MDALKRIVFLLILAGVGALGVRHFLFEKIVIASESMEPTLPKGTELYVDKLAPFLGAPKRGDIVMFDSPFQPEKGLVKRVIGLSGETIEIRNKTVYINGQLLDEPYAHHEHMDVMWVGDNVAPQQIPANHVFVMGDNRDVSGDSRDWRTSSGDPRPYLSRQEILGVIKAPR
jgi:signal peptidase I